jgi:hypothetical protein
MAMTPLARTGVETDPLQPPRLKVGELSLVMGLGLLFAALQMAHLYMSISPDTDEGVYAEAGRLMLAGKVPYRDFPLSHMPLFPLLVGVGLRLAGSMYGVRLLSVLINCLAVVPLYIALRWTVPDARDARAAALCAAAFYSMYHEMVFHDYRSVAIRPLVNVCVLVYFALGTVRTSRLWITFTQALLSLSVAMLFLPGLANVALISSALIVTTDRDRRWLAVRRYAAIGVVTVAAIALVFWMIPGSLQKVVLDHLNRSPVPRLWRLSYVLQQPEERFFYVLSTGSLIVAAAAVRGLRTWSAAMLAIIAISLLAPSNFYLHYVTVAAPALAFGIFAFALEISHAAQLSRRHARALVYGALTLTVCTQAAIVMPGLLREWGASNADRRLLIDRLARSPEPVLTVKPIYAVEAHKHLVAELEPVYMDPPVESRHFDVEDYLHAGAKACTIVLEKAAYQTIPAHALEQWRRDYESVFANPAGTLLLTHHPECATSSR